VFITLNPYSNSALLRGVFFTAFIAGASVQLVDELRSSRKITGSIPYSVIGIIH
jgi:hypothetical protein